MSTESDYWSRLRTYLVPSVYVFKINAGYVRGIPDEWLSGSKQDLWIENKRIAGDKDPPAILDLTDRKKYLTQHQQTWLVSRHIEGRKVGVIVFSKRGHIFLPGITWQKPIIKLDFLEACMPPGELAKRLINLVGELPIPKQIS